LLGFEKPELLVGKAVMDYLPISSSHYHVKNEDGRFVLRYEESLPTQEERKLQITVSNMPYGKELASLLLLRPAEPKVVDNNEEMSFRTLSRMMSDYAYSIEIKPDGSLKFLWVAGAISQITGLTEEKVMALEGWESLVYSDDLGFFKLRQMALLNGEQRSLEYRIMRPDGKIRWVQDNASPMRDSESQKVYRILGEAQDITERIQAQEVLRTHVVQQAVVAELGLLALSLFEPSHLLSHAVVLCEQVLEANFCVIFEHDAQTQELVARSSSRPDEIVPIGRRLSDNPQTSLLAYTLSAQEAIVSEDLMVERRFTVLPEILESAFHSAMAVVIMGQSSPYGVMCVYSQKRQVYDNDEIYFLQSVSNVLGTFIERHRAQAAEREQREFAEALRDATAMINSRLELPDVLDKMLAYLRQVVPQMENASIMLWDEKLGMYQFVSVWGFSEESKAALEKKYFTEDHFPLLNRVIEQKRPLIIDDTYQEPLWVRTHYNENEYSYLGAPIFVREECIGFLHLNSSNIKAFSAKDAEHLQAFADKTGTAILNARRAEELEQLVTIRTDELKKQSEQLATILNSTGEGIFYVEDGRIVFANQRLCEMTGYKLDDLIGKDADIFLPSALSEDEARRLQVMEDNIRLGKVSRVELRFLRNDQQIFEVGITSSALQASDGILRKVSVIRDISQEKELANLKNRFIANAAHDLRSPITSLKTRMYMIGRQPEQIPYHLEKLDQVINRMNRLVGDLLDSASIGQGHVTLRQESIILQDVLERVVEILRPEAEEARIDLSLSIPEQPLQVWADAIRLEQVFTNLITNAIHFSPNGKISVICDKTDSDVLIEVMDTGAGIPAESLEFIFQPFYRVDPNSKVKGTGLGLSITRDIVERHKGKISVSSEVGKGSCFSVTLPLLKD
jgi:two-component system phosphate regulon sensor histidine kinase PhoR